MQIKTTVRYYTPTRRTIIKKTSIGDNVKKLGPSYSAHDHGRWYSLAFLKWLNTELSDDPAVLLLGFPLAWIYS